MRKRDGSPRVYREAACANGSLLNRQFLMTMPVINTPVCNYAREDTLPRNFQFLTFPSSLLSLIIIFTIDQLAIYNIIKRVYIQRVRLTSYSIVPSI